VRYIDIESLSLPPDWETDAKNVFAKLTVAVDTEARKKIISDYSELWRKLKKTLSGLSHDKCWYCESKQIRSDNAVDHFRPKNRVADCPGHEGYWWLAFDWRNYRFSCTYCNSRRKGDDTEGGKADEFPLMDENDRAMTWSSSLALEKPILLDPTNRDDIELLWFYIDGTPKPRFSQAQDEIKHKRAMMSISLYHLDQTPLEERRQDLYSTLSRIIKRADDALDDATNAKTEPMKQKAQRQFKETVQEIRNLTNPKAELSSVARIYLMTFADADGSTQRAWVNQLIAKLESKVI